MILSRPLLALAATTVVAAASLPAGPGAQAGSDDPLELFEKVAPVFQHPRCSNCHGGTFPEVPQNHPQKVEPEEDCTNCHTTSPTWTQERAATFAGLSAFKLCDIMARFVAANGADSLRKHIANDKLIHQSFTGLIGGAARSPRPVPLLTYAKFREGMMTWLDDGLGMCNREGRIEHEEAINTDNTTHEGPAISTNVRQSGRRFVTVQFSNGQYKAHVQVEGSITITKTIRGVVNGRPCSSIITSTADYADVDDPNRGPNAGRTMRARVEVKFGAGGKYTVAVQLPPERHRQLDGGSFRGDCGITLPPGDPDPGPRETTSEPTTFMFRGTLPASGDRTQLVGHEVRDVSVRVSPDEDPWMFDHYAAAAPQDSPNLHPVTVSTFWNFRYRP